MLSSSPADAQDLSLRFFVAMPAILITETRSSGARDQCRVALDLTSVRADITCCLLCCDVMFHQRLEDPAGFTLVTLLLTVTELELNLRPESDRSSVTPWGTQFVAGARAMSLQLAAASYICVQYVLKKMEKQQWWWQTQLHK